MSFQASAHNNKMTTGAISVALYGSPDEVRQARLKIDAFLCDVLGEFGGGAICWEDVRRVAAPRPETPKTDTTRASGSDKVIGG